MAKFRFQDLEIWKLSVEISDRLFDIADELELNSLLERLDLLSRKITSFRNSLK